MRQPPPPGLRLVLVFFALFAAAGVGYVLYHADKYLFDTERWLFLGGGIVLAVTILGLAFRWRDFAIYLMLTAMSTLVALFGAEIALRSVPTSVAPAGPGAFGAATAVEMIRSAEAKGQRLRPLSYQAATIHTDSQGRYHSRLRIREQEVMKLGGPSRAWALFYDNVALEFAQVATDRHGHLNDDAVWRQGPVDVLVVGASNTQGGGARFGHDFVSLLEAEQRSVARLALGGIGPLTKLALVREFGPLLKPRTVFWVYADHNDLEDDLKRELKTPILANYLKADYRQGLPELEAALDRLADPMVMAYLTRQASERPAAARANVSPKFDWNGFLKLGRLRGRLGIVVGTPVTSAQLSAWAKTMALANQDIKAWGGRLVLVYLPMLNTLRTGDDDPFKPYVLNVLHDLDVPLVDFTNDLIELADPTVVYRKADGSLSNHYNEDGHRRLAQSMAEFLQRGTANDTIAPTAKRSDDR